MGSAGGVAGSPERPRSRRGTTPAPGDPRPAPGPRRRRFLQLFQQLVEDRGVGEVGIAGGVDEGDRPRTGFLQDPGEDLRVVPELRPIPSTEGRVLLRRMTEPRPEPVGGGELPEPLLEREPLPGHPPGPQPIDEVPLPIGWRGRRVSPLRPDRHGSRASGGPPLPGPWPRARPRRRPLPGTGIVGGARATAGGVPWWPRPSSAGVERAPRGSSGSRARRSRSPRRCSRPGGRR